MYSSARIWHHWTSSFSREPVFPLFRDHRPPLRLFKKNINNEVKFLFFLQPFLDHGPVWNRKPNVGRNHTTNKMVSAGTRLRSHPPSHHHSSPCSSPPPTPLPPPLLGLNLFAMQSRVLPHSTVSQKDLQLLVMGKNFSLSI